MGEPEIKIEVASRPEAADILSSPTRCAEVTCLVSIGDLHDQLPACLSPSCPRATGARA
jgi:hypothetical protein